MFEKLKELFKYRELLLNFVIRELKLKYRGSVLGFLWSFLNPLAMMLVYTIVFAFFLRIGPPVGANGLNNFAAYLLCGLLPWNFLNTSLSYSVGSLVDSGDLISKVYFPRELIPFSRVLANLVSFLTELAVLFVFLLVLGNSFLLLVPVLIVVVLIETFFVLGLALLVSVANLYYRDTKHLLGVILTLWFFASPIVYPFKLIVDAAAAHNFPWLVFVYKLNPFASLALVYQETMYFLKFPDWKLLAYTMAVAIVSFLIGYKVFSKFEPYFAEEV